MLTLMPIIPGFVLLIVTYFIDKKVIRIQWNSVASFISFMFLITFIRIAGFDLMQRFDASFLMPAPSPEIMNIGIWWFVMVWWEDAFYALSLYWAHKKLKPILAWILTIFLSLHFGISHLYSGWFWAFAVSFYPFFISLKYGKRVGFGTVMICHIIYDFMTFFTIWLLPHLLPAIRF